MIVRVWSGSLLFVLVILPPNGPFATTLDGNTGSSTVRPRNTSVLNESNADNTSATFDSSFNQTGITLENETVPETGEEARTDPNVRDDSAKRIEDKNSTKSNAESSNATDTDVRHGYTREVHTSTAFLITSALLRQQDLETSHDESTTAADQDLTVTPRELQTNYSSVELDSPSASFKKNYTGRTTSSRAYTGSSAKNVLENENTHSSRKAAGITEVTSIMVGPAGKLVRRTGPEHHVLSSTATPAVDPATPDFKTETKLDQTFGRATDGHGQVTQTDDVRNWKRDVNVTRLDVTKSELAYKSLWDDADTEDDEGKMEADGGGGRGGTSRKGIAGGGAAEPGGTAKRTDGKKDDDGRFTIPAELRRARNRNEHFSLSFHGLPWREELNILVPVLCGMFGAMILVLAAYFLRNCPNNIRRLARMSRPSKLHRRKSDLNLLIDNSSGDENP